MMYRLKNLVGSPFDIHTASGPAILPANGEVVAEFSASDVEMFRMSAAVEIAEITQDDPKPEKKAEKPAKK